MTVCVLVLEIKQESCLMELMYNLVKYNEIHAMYRSMFVVGSHACSKGFCLVSLVVPHLDPESDGHRFVPYKTVEHFTC